ncbi:MAG: branched-chain amino acid ABC transporter permease [Deltaproteobacteria bacterium]|nr:MAG: branched-chain amino acid ABC transporter permease [Deltaproteobacteria bacterium]
MAEALRRERLDRGIKVRTEGIYAISHWQEIAYLLLPRLLLIVGMLSLPIIFMVAPYWQRVICVTSVFIFLAMAFDFLANFVGLVCLGGAFFVGVGGYLTAIFNTKMGLSPLLSLPLATVTGALICTLLLLPTLPLRGIYFAIVTLMYPLAFSKIIEALDLLGGTDGMPGVVPLPNQWIEQYLIVGLALVALFGLRRLVNEDIGLVFRGIKDNDQAVKASGINVSLYKAMAVFLASLLGCFAGAYMAHLYMWAGLSLFALDFSIMPIAATVIGGGGTLVGPFIGSLILVPLSEFLRTFGTLRIVFYALILTAFIVLKSEGLMVYLQRKYHQFERWVKV